MIEQILALAWQLHVQPLPPRISPYWAFLQSHALPAWDLSEAAGSQELPDEVMAICANNKLTMARERGAVMLLYR